MTQNATPPSSHETIRRLEQYIESDPQNTSLLATLADHYHQIGRLADAFACYQRCLDLQPNDVRARSRAALVLISQHRFADAEKSIRALINEGESDAALFHNLGIAQLYQHDWVSAVQSFSRATELGLNTAANLCYLARALHGVDRVDDAIRAMGLCIQLAPTPPHRGYLALLEMEAGHMSQAFALAHEVLALDPNNVDANVVAGTEALEQQNEVEARRYFQTAIAHDENNGRAWLGLGLVHLDDQQPARAIDALERAARIFPTNSGIRVTLGWANIIATNFSAAQETFERALDVDHNFSESHAGLAASLVLQGKHDRATEEINLARRLDPRSFGAAVAGSFLHAAQGNQQAAKRMFDKMLEQSPREDVPPIINQLRIYLAKKSPLTSRL